MLDWSTCSVVERDPQRMSGGWVFRGTRVPVSALFENLEDGVEITEFVRESWRRTPGHVKEGGLWRSEDELSCR